MSPAPQLFGEQQGDGSAAGTDRRGKKRLAKLVRANSGKALR